MLSMLLRISKCLPKYLPHRKNSYFYDRILDSLERDTSPIDASIKDFNMKEASLRDANSNDKVCL